MFNKILASYKNAPNINFNFDLLPMKLRYGKDLNTNTIEISLLQEDEKIPNLCDIDLSFTNTDFKEFICISHHIANEVVYVTNLGSIISSTRIQNYRYINELQLPSTISEWYVTHVNNASKIYKFNPCSITIGSQEYIVRNILFTLLIMGHYYMELMIKPEYEMSKENNLMFSVSFAKFMSLGFFKNYDNYDQLTNDDKKVFKRLLEDIDMVFKKINFTEYNYQTIYNMFLKIIYVSFNFHNKVKTNNSSYYHFDNISGSYTCRFENNFKESIYIYKRVYDDLMDLIYKYLTPRLIDFIQTKSDSIVNIYSFADDYYLYKKMTTSEKIKSKFVKSYKIDLLTRFFVNDTTKDFYDSISEASLIHYISHELNDRSKDKPDLKALYLPFLENSDKIKQFINKIYTDILCSIGYIIKDNIIKNFRFDVNAILNSNYLHINDKQLYTLDDIMKKFCYNNDKYLYLMISNQYNDLDNGILNIYDSFLKISTQFKFNDDVWQFLSIGPSPWFHIVRLPYIMELKENPNDVFYNLDYYLQSLRIDIKAAKLKNYVNKDFYNPKEYVLFYPLMPYNTLKGGLIKNKKLYLAYTYFKGVYKYKQRLIY